MSAAETTAPGRAAASAHLPRIVPSLWESLASNASAIAELRCWTTGGWQAASWSEVAREAEQMTLGLRRAGVRPGARVAALLTNGPAVVRGLLGTWLAGGSIASLPLPARGMDSREHEQQLLGICERLEPSLLMVEERLASAVPEAVARKVRVRSWEAMAGSGRVEPAPPEEDQIAFMQLSSGSTSSPKGCMLSTRAIRAQIALLSEMIDARGAEDVAVSWLPLSHDMGMFGCLLTAWANGINLWLSPPERFLMAPRSWLADAVAAQATIGVTTNAALALGSRPWASARLPAPLALRILIVGAERVRWETLRSALQTLSPYGLREEALMPAYGLAEACLALTATPLDRAPRALSLDARALAAGALCDAQPDDPAATQVVSAGLPCTGVVLESPGAPGSIEEIWARSPSLASGYLGDPQLSAERFRAGVLRTGDLGFVRDGELWPLGRLDDLISLGGRNVFAQEIELAVESLPEVRRGCCALVERIDGEGGLVLCLEPRREGLDWSALAGAAARLSLAKAAVSLQECLILPRDSLPKTPSGKVQRHRLRALLASERLCPLARVRLGQS